MDFPDLFDMDLLDGGEVLDSIDSTIDDFSLIDSPETYSPSFMGSNSDGFIPNGTITLDRTNCGIEKCFEVFRKDGHLWIEESPNHFVRVDGSGTVNINGFKYNKI